MKLSELYLNRYLYRDNNQNSETKGADFESADSSGDDPSYVASGGSAEDINQGNVPINPALLPDTTINVGDWGWTQNCAFSSTDTDTVSWGSGTFFDAAGNSYSISAGNTGNMSQKTYIYLSLLDSETVYQTTTTSSDAVGLGKVLIAVAKNESDAATYNLTEAEQIVGDNILVNTIDASKIVVGSLIVGTNVAIGSAEDAAGVTTIVGNTVDTGYVNALAITVLGTVTAGEIQVINGGNTIGLTPGGTNAIFAGTTGSPQFKVTPAGAVTCSNITITGGTIQWSTVNGTTNAPDSNATVGATLGTNVSGGGTGNNEINNSGYVTTITATSITTGTLSAIDVQSGTGNERIILDNGNYIRYYASNVLRASVRGTTSGSGGLFQTGGDYYLQNNHSFFIASTTGGSSEYGGVSVTNSNELWITLGTGNDFFIKNNAQSANYFTVSSTRAYINGYLYLNTETSNPTTNRGAIWHYSNSGTDQFRGVPTGTTIYSFDMTAV